MPLNQPGLHGFPKPGLPKTSAAIAKRWHRGARNPYYNVTGVPCVQTQPPKLPNDIVRAFLEWTIAKVRFRYAKLVKEELVEVDIYAYCGDFVGHPSPAS
ncbi:uncharacterized protein PHALS_10394 [Plasmopara halstedii]|uniref:Uncharacterized protein n=1 Tax=Plasmopara halstedii TaxID=4781 RepID=A0A0P1AGD8_PLAHL|nr:uncharacterized protein PHALS_10394 [Plasmopara halstedii]CEG40182.1 hypothetical protein PHALS_10394 [Plasmopara halstedii]|eukprot:XP_024576551.1 hypothetical protein PHALS_10394 [Plasmopara halstedii]